MSKTQHETRLIEAARSALALTSRPFPESRVLHLDFESRSDVDLKSVGVRRYCESPYTSAMCVGWAFDDLPVQGAHLFPFAECPSDVAEHVRRGGLACVHNASFELNFWAMLRRRDPQGWPELSAVQVVDTMALARLLSLPGDLKTLSKALKLPLDKDAEGHALMLRLCKPRRPRKGEPTHFPLWNGTEAELDRQLEYCRTDVDVERNVYNLLPDMSDRERRIWLFDKKVNDLGLQVDAAAVPRLIEVADAEKDRLNSELQELTGGTVRTSNSHAKFREWLEHNGCVVANLQKDTITKILDADLFPKTAAGRAAKRAVEIRQENSKSSVAKLAAMQRGTCELTGRLHELFEFSGAGTRRWAGRRVQPQNMMRPPEGFKLDDARLVVDIAKQANSVESAISQLQAKYESASAAIAFSMRALICARDGYRFLAADYANIEGRVLAWLSGEDWKLSAFTEFDTFETDAAGVFVLDDKGKKKPKGPDLYKLAFARAFNIPVDEVAGNQRQIGKVMELALGYQGAHGAFLSMAKNYSLDLGEIAAAVKASASIADWDDALARYWAGAIENAEDALADLRARNQIAQDEGRDDEIEDEPDVRDLALSLVKGNRFGLEAETWAALRIIVDGWRSAHWRTVAFWKALEVAAIDAVKNPGVVFPVGKVMYRKSGDFLYCRLPSGDCLAYPYARIVRERSKFDPDRFDEKLIYEGVSSKTRRWQTQRAYGGLLAENITQAVARDVLADAMLRLDAAGYDIPLHVHDEAVCEMLSGRGALSEVYEIMKNLEPWCAGLPVAVDGWEGDRFWK